MRSPYYGGRDENRQDAKSKVILSRSSLKSALTSLVFGRDNGPSLLSFRTRSRNHPRHPTDSPLPCSVSAPTPRRGWTPTCSSLPLYRLSNIPLIIGTPGHYPGLCRASQISVHRQSFVHVARGPSAPGHGHSTVDPSGSSQSPLPPLQKSFQRVEPTSSLLSAVPDFRRSASSPKDLTGKPLRAFHS